MAGTEPEEIMGPNWETSTDHIQVGDQENNLTGNEKDSTKSIDVEGEKLNDSLL